MQDNHDDTGGATDQSVPRQPGTGTGAAEVRNMVNAAASGVVVQAHTISGGVHNHHYASPGRPVPRQLPAVPTSFIGRTAELAKLTTAMDQALGAGGTMVISALAGAGGIGKTWLVLHWAHQHRDRFPDGQLFVDLHGFSPAGKPMEAPAAVRGFLDALNIAPARIPADLHAQAALYRSLVAGKRMLIVLDNAATADQISLLLPGDPSCTVVVTSRRRLTSMVTGHGAQPVHLDVLTGTEGRQLLTAHLGRSRIEAEPDAVAQLVAFCGGFPLALAIVAGRARTTPRMPLVTLAAELRDEATRLDVLDSDDPAASLPAVLSWSHHALTPDQRMVFGLLGIAPGPDIGLPAAASITGLTPVRTKRVLNTLEDASLLDHDGHGRWRMHDLIRAYANTTAHHGLAEAAREEALRQVLDFYTHTAHNADSLLNRSRTSIHLDQPAPGTRPQPLSDAPAALAWFDTEHANLIASQQIAVNHQWHAIVWKLAWAQGTFLRRRGHRYDWLPVWLAALTAAAHLPGPTASILAHRHLGSVYAHLGRHKEAIRHLHQALALAEHHKTLTQQALTLRTLAQAWEQRGDHQQAFEHSTRALNLYRTFNQPTAQAVALSQVGWHAALLGDYGTALTHCHAALTLHQHHHDPDGEAHTLRNLGFIAHHTDQHEQALDYYRRSLTLLRQTGCAYHEVMALLGMGEAHAALSEHNLARAAWREALQLYREQGRDEDAQRVQRQLDDLDANNDGDQPPRTTEPAP